MNTGSTTVETGAARFSRHVAWTLGAKVGIATGSLLSGMIVARWLGAESVGVLALLTVVSAVAATFGSFGMTSAITFLVARDRRYLRSVVFNAIFFSLAAGGLLAAVLAAVAHAKPGLFNNVPEEFVLIAACAIPFQMLSQFCLAAFLGLQSVGRYNMLDVVMQAALVINPLVVVCALGLGLNVLVILNAATSILLSVVILYLLLRAVKPAPAEPSLGQKSVLVEMLRYGSKFYISLAASLIILRADLLIVNYYRGSVEAGVYAISTQVGMLLMMLPFVISTVLFPRVTEARDTSGEMTCRVTRHSALIMLAACLATVPLAFLLPVLYGPAFAAVPLQVVVLLPGVYLLGLETVQVQYFNSIGVPRAIPAFWIATMVINVTLDLLFVPAFGAIAAAAVSSVSYALMFILVAVYFRNQTGCSFRDAFLMRSTEIHDLPQAGRLLAAPRERKA